MRIVVRLRARLCPKEQKKKNITLKIATPLNYPFALIKINAEYTRSDYSDMDKKVFALRLKVHVNALKPQEGR